MLIEKFLLHTLNTTEMIYSSSGIGNSLYSSPDPGDSHCL